MAGNTQLTEKQQFALNTALQGHNIILTGQCGTGKTFLLRSIINKLFQQGRRVSVTATTGIASTHLGPSATTIHSWCGILDGRFSQRQLKELVCSDERFSDARERIKSTDVLVIDEIGMASQKMFEMVEMVCRIVKHSDFLFGGLQVIASGDFKQLPPVPNIRYGDMGNHCFMSDVFREFFPHHINLDVVVRQNELPLIIAVNELCEGKPSQETEQFFKSLDRSLPESTDDITRLFGTNFDTSYINQEMLDDLEGELFLFKAKDTDPKHLLLQCPGGATLALKVGAPVVLVRNLSGGLMNGMIGKVVELQHGHPPIVNFGGRIVPLELVRFDIYDPRQKRSLASRHQFPIKLAYALTVQRAQGMTLPKVEVDCYSFFAPGQLGVAVGRSVSTSGLRIVNYNSRAANLLHSEGVYDFYFHESTKPEADLSCCKKRYQLDEVQEENLDEENEISAKNMQSTSQETLQNTQEKSPWSLQEFQDKFKDSSFKEGVNNIEILQKVCNLHFVTVKDFLKKNPKSSEDFVQLYSKVNSYI